MELLRGLGALASALLLAALCVLPVSEPVLRETELVSWGSASLELLAPVSLVQRSVRVRKEVSARRLEPGDRSANQSSATASHLNTSLFATPAGAPDAPAWRRAHGVGHHLFYLHIWKCGGTNLCNIARANGEQAHADWGCHTPDATRQLGWNPCAEPAAFDAAFPDLTFVGSECPLKATMPFDDPKWSFVVVLRHPLTQATSWYLHARQVNKKAVGTFMHWLQKVKTRRGIFFDTFEDNLQTRFVCGWQCNEKVELDEDDFAIAQANLRKFKVVLRLEEFDSEHGLDAAQSIGWKMMSGVDHSIGTKHHVTEAIAAAKFPQVAKHLAAAQKWDAKLYEYSKTLFPLSSAEAAGVLSVRL